MTSKKPEKQAPSADRPNADRPSADKQRLVLLDAASEMLAQEGPGAISLRKLAAKIGKSTMTIYTGFGGKSGLIDALYAEGFKRLGDAQQAAATDPNPLVRLGKLAEAYRTFALANPNYYALMINVIMPLTDKARSTENVPAARLIAQERAYEYLIETVADAIKQAYLRPDLDAAKVADVFWAAVHGHCSLELAGYYKSEKDAAERFDLIRHAVITSFTTDKARALLEQTSTMANPA